MLSHGSFPVSNTSLHHPHMTTADTQLRHSSQDTEVTRLVPTFTCVTRCRSSSLSLESIKDTVIICARNSGANSRQITPDNDNVRMHVDFVSGSSNANKSLRGAASLLLY